MCGCFIFFFLLWKNKKNEWRFEIAFCRGFVLQRSRYWMCTVSTSIASTFAVAFSMNGFFCWCVCGVDLDSWCRYEVEISESRGHDFRNVLFTFWTRFHNRSQNNIAHSCELKRTYFDMNLTVHEENGRISHDYYWVGGDSPDVPTPNVNYLHVYEYFIVNFSRVNALHWHLLCIRDEISGCQPPIQLPVRTHKYEPMLVTVVIFVCRFDIDK